MHRFLHETGSVTRRIGSGRPSKVTAKIKQFIEEQMKKDDKTTALPVVGDGLLVIFANNSLMRNALG